MKLFLQKNAKFLSAWGSAPKPPAFGGWGFCSQTPIGLRRLGAQPPEANGPQDKTALPIAPKQPSTLRISGYAPGYMHAF